MIVFAAAVLVLGSAVAGRGCRRFPVNSRWRTIFSRSRANFFPFAHGNLSRKLLMNMRIALRMEKIFPLVSRSNGNLDRYADVPAAGSIAEGETVLARLGAADQDAAFAVDPDRLTAAERHLADFDLVARRASSARRR